jgi:hypothetical protein
MEAYHHTTVLREDITTLRDPRRDVYYRLSSLGWFLWQRLDGEHTLQDLTTDYGTKYGVPPPHAVVETVAGLVEASFAEGARLGPGVQLGIDGPTLWQRSVAAIRRILE